MTCRLATLLLALGCVVVPSSAAATASSRFVVIDGDGAEALERNLKSAGSQGYRLVASANGTDVTGRSRIAVLLERDPGGRTVEFAVRVGTGDLTDPSMRRAIDPLFEDGYRFSTAGFVVGSRPEMWLPASAYADQATIILERPADVGARRSYLALDFGSEEAFHSQLAERTGEGFEVLGLWNTDRRLQVVLQRSLDDGRPPAVGATQRLLLAATRKALKLSLNPLARRGYRIRQAEDPPTAGPPILLLQQTAGPDEFVEYRFLSKVPNRMRTDRFLDKLSRYAAKGWRLTPGGLTDNVFTLERDPRRDRSAPRATYRLIASASADELASALEQAVAGGERLVTMVVEPARTSLLVERLSAGGSERHSRNP